MSTLKIKNIDIDEFFKRDDFSQEDLDRFKENIKKNCNHNSELKGFLNIVNLHLLKFKLQDIVNIGKKEKPNKSNFSKPVINYKSKIAIRRKGESWIDFLRNKTIYKILIEISETEKKECFLNLLKEKGYYKGSINYVLTEQQFSSIEEALSKFLESNRKNIGTKIITNSRKITQNRSISNSNTVYVKISHSNSTGKLIYIRSK